MRRWVDLQSTLHSSATAALDLEEVQAILPTSTKGSAEAVAICSVLAAAPIRKSALLVVLARAAGADLTATAGTAASLVAVGRLRLPAKPSPAAPVVLAVVAAVVSPRVPTLSPLCQAPADLGAPAAFKATTPLGPWAVAARASAARSSSMPELWRSKTISSSITPPWGELADIRARTTAKARAGRCLSIVEQPPATMARHSARDQAPLISRRMPDLPGSAARLHPIQTARPARARTRWMFAARFYRGRRSPLPLFHRRR